MGPEHPCGAHDARVLCNFAVVVETRNFTTPYSSSSSVSARSRPLPVQHKYISVVPNQYSATSPTQNARRRRHRHHRGHVSLDATGAVTITQ
eukprot:1161529-Pelagomonas_calceolata.AAC.4